MVTYKHGTRLRISATVPSQTIDFGGGQTIDIKSNEDNSIIYTVDKNDAVGGTINKQIILQKYRTLSLWIYSDSEFSNLINITHLELTDSNNISYQAYNVVNPSFYVFKNLKVGTYTLSIQAANHITYTEQFQITEQDDNGVLKSVTLTTSKHIVEFNIKDYYTNQNINDFLIIAFKPAVDKYVYYRTNNNTLNIPNNSVYYFLIVANGYFNFYISNSGGTTNETINVLLYNRKEISILGYGEDKYTWPTSYLYEPQHSDEFVVAGSSFASSRNLNTDYNFEYDGRNQGYAYLLENIKFNKDFFIRYYPHYFILAGGIRGVCGQVLSKNTEPIVIDKIYGEKILYPYITKETFNTALADYTCNIELKEIEFIDITDQCTVTFDGTPITLPFTQQNDGNTHDVDISCNGFYTKHFKISAGKLRSTVRYKDNIDGDKLILNRLYANVTINFATQGEHTIRLVGFNNDIINSFEETVNNISQKIYECLYYGCYIFVDGVSHGMVNGTDITINIQ